MNNTTGLPCCALTLSCCICQAISSSAACMLRRGSGGWPGWGALAGARACVGGSSQSPSPLPSFLSPASRGLRGAYEGGEVQADMLGIRMRAQHGGHGRHLLDGRLVVHMMLVSG